MRRNRIFGRVLAIALLLCGARAAPAQGDCGDPSARCGALIGSACLSRAGAGTLAADAPESCAAQFDAYRDCLAEVAVECAAPVPPAAAEAERVPPGHRLVAQTPVAGGRLLFLLAPEPLSWSAAEQAAAAMGGRLAVIDTADKQEAMASVLARRPELFHSAVVFFATWVWGPWLGGYQRADATGPAEGWVWSLDPATGASAPIIGGHWFDGQPNDFGGPESYLQIFCINRATCDTWNDAAADAPVRSYIVELRD